MKVYIVTDVGTSMPCAGILFGVFSTREKAQDLVDRIQTDPDAWT